NLRYQAHLGFYDDERAGLQPVEISLRLYFPGQPDWAGDDHAAFIDYARMVKLYKDAIEGKEFRLIEYMGQEMFALTRRFLDAHNGGEVKLWMRLTKCAPPIEAVKGGASYIHSDLPPGATVIPAGYP